MNFFEQQDRARKQSRWLIIVFIVAVLAIVVAIDLLILLAAGVSSIETEGVTPLSPQLFADNLVPAHRRGHRNLAGHRSGQPVQDHGPESRRWKNRP